MILYPFKDNLKASNKSLYEVCTLSKVSSLAYAVRSEVINLSYFGSIANILLKLLHVSYLACFYVQG